MSTAVASLAPFCRARNEKNAELAPRSRTRRPVKSAGVKTGVSSPHSRASDWSAGFDMKAVAREHERLVAAEGRRPGGQGQRGGPCVLVGRSAGAAGGHDGPPAVPGLRAAMSATSTRVAGRARTISTESTVNPAAAASRHMLVNEP